MGGMHRERVRYGRQLNFLVAVFFVCAALSLTGCGRQPLTLKPFFGTGGGGGGGGDTQASTNHGRGSSADTLTQLPNDPQLSVIAQLLFNGISASDFSLNATALFAPFGVRSMAVLNTFPKVNLVNLAVGGLVDVLKLSAGNYAYAGYVARYTGGTADNNFVSGRLTYVPPGLENINPGYPYPEAGLYAEIWAKTTAHGHRRHAMEKIARHADIVSPIASFSSKMFLELALYDMEALIYVNGKLAASGHQCDQNAAGEIGIEGMNGAVLHSLDAVPFPSGPRVFRDYFDQDGSIYLKDDWTVKHGFFNKTNAAVPAPGQHSLAVVPRLQMEFFNIAADVDVRDFSGATDIHAGIVAKYKGPALKNYYLGRIRNRNGQIWGEIWKVLGDGARHLLAESLISGSSSFGASGRVRFTLQWEGGKQMLRLYYRPTGSVSEAEVTSVHHGGITGLGSAGIEALNARVDNFEVFAGEDDRQIENP